MLSKFRHENFNLKHRSVRNCSAVKVSKSSHGSSRQSLCYIFQFTDGESFIQSPANSL